MTRCGRESKVWRHSWVTRDFKPSYPHSSFVILFFTAEYAKGRAALIHPQHAAVLVLLHQHGQARDADEAEASGDAGFGVG